MIKINKYNKNNKLNFEILRQFLEIIVNLIQLFLHSLKPISFAVRNRA